MSANYVYPGQAYAHTLTPLKGWYREAALDAEVKLSSNVNINSTGAPAHSGLVVHATDVTASTDFYGGPIDGPGTFVVEMGCGAGHGMPMFLWPGSTDPDISNPGVTAGTPAAGDGTYGPPDHISVFPQVAGQNMMALVASGGYEVESTEFDADQTYTPGNGLRAVTSNTDANAGKVTNQGASSAGFTSSTTLLWGLAPNNAASALDTIVGVVSRKKYTNANRKPVLAYYTWFIPGTR